MGSKARVSPGTPGTGEKYKPMQAYVRAHWRSQDSIIGQVIAPYPPPRLRGIHEWAAYTCSDPRASASASITAPIGSVLVTVVQFCVLMLLAFEIIAPTWCEGFGRVFGRYRGGI